jgi:probable HAF family extracellular repeat protein
MDRNFLAVVVRRQVDMPLRSSWLEPAKSGLGSKLSALLLCAGVVSSLLLSAAQAQIKYTLTELEGLRSQYTYPIAINSGGEVVGTYLWNNGSSHSFIYRGGALHDLGTLSGYTNYVTAVNNYGQVTGYFNNGSGSTLGYLRASDGSVTLIGGSGFDNVAPAAINDSGVIIGNYGTGNNARGFIYENGRIAALGSFAGRPLTTAIAINNRSQILAFYQLVDADNTNRTIIYHEGNMQDIGSLPGSRGTFGYFINDHAVILGGYLSSFGGIGNFIYSAGQFQDLGVESGVNNQSYYGINNTGQIVGSNIGTTGRNFAIITTGTQEQDLNSLIDPTAGVYLSVATGINVSGQICAGGTNASGTQVAFVLTPIK